MVWRSRTSSTDRFFACLVYLLPLVEAYLLASGLLQLLQAFVPAIGILLLPLQLAASIYIAIIAPFSFGGFGIGGFLIFVLLIALVVRNDRICHFVRFNTMQAIIIGIALSLFSILWALINTIVPLDTTLVSILVIGGLFFGTVGISIYSIVQSALGKYAEIPTLSDAAYVQVQ